MKAKTRLLTLILPSLMLAGTSAAIIAQDAKPTDADASAQMKTLDTGKDGTVDKAEAGKMTGLSDHFDVADKNKDGKLDAAELATALSMIKK